MHEQGLTVFVILLLGGLFLIGAEIYVPGGVLGLIGAVSLLAAIVIAFLIFPPQTAFLVAVGIIILLGICIFLWIRYFPRTRLGRSLTLARDGRNFHAQRDDLSPLVGKMGSTVTSLRPSGVALIEGRRYDVVAQGSWVDKGVKVKVVDVSGNRVMVRPIVADKEDLKE